MLNAFEIDVLCAVTAVTAQSNTRVAMVHHIPPEVIRAQIAAAFESRAVAAIKIGMLGTRTTVEAVAASLPLDAAIPIVLDPVLMASSGGELLDAEGRSAMLAGLFPRATILTPNIPEAAVLLGEATASGEPALTAQARRLLALGPQSILLKGGHHAGEEAVDLLVSRNDVVRRIAAARIAATHRGTGCALASAIAAGLASGMSVVEACQQGKRYVTELLSAVLSAQQSIPHMSFC